jgi:hypothetical protein
MAEGYQREIGLLPSQAIDTTRLIGGPAIVTRFALRKLRPTFEDSNQLSPVGLGSSPSLYIQSEVLQDIALHLSGVRIRRAQRANRRL